MALAKSLEQDTFVINRTVQWIKNHPDITDEIAPELYELVIKFLDNDEVFAQELINTFCSDKSFDKKSALSSRNLGIIRYLKQYLEGRIAIKKEGHEDPLI
jgi:hypothetical protein